MIACFALSELAKQYEPLVKYPVGHGPTFVNAGRLLSEFGVQ
jgi:hypothetical protein